MEEELELIKGKSYGSHRQELILIEQDIKRIDNRINKLESSNRPDVNKLSQLIQKRLELKKRRKIVKKDSDDAFDLAYKKFIETMTLEESKTLANKYYGCLSTRGQNLVEKYKAYYDGENWIYDKQKHSMDYYLSVAYMIYLFISKKKKINRFIILSDDFVFDCGTYCELFEAYLKEMKMQRFIVYIKKLVNK